MVLWLLLQEYVTMMMIVAYMAANNLIALQYGLEKYTTELKST